MSNIANLHSLLSGKYMITDEFANSLYPYIATILSKGTLPNAIENKTSNIYFSSVSQDIFDEEDYENIEEEASQQVVAVLPIKGPILKYSQFCGPTGTKSLQAKLEKWKADDNIVAILLDIDSGGGQVAGTGEFAEYLNNYPKRIEAYTDGVIASAAYHIAAPTKKITANPHADAIGSIGTMYKSLNLDGYFEKLGAKVNEVYATKSTKKNFASRQLKEGNTTPLIIEELDPINESFHNQIKKYRPSINSEVFDGNHTVVIEKAKEMGMIDAIADKTTTINSLFEAAKKSTSNKNNNTLNKTNMADQKINLEQISAALGIEGGLKISSKILSGKKGAFLSQEELQLIESLLSDNTSNLQKAQENLDTEKVSNKKRTDAVTAALATASLEAAETEEASIALLGAKVAEYGAQPGVKTSQPISNGDRNEEVKESTAIMDSI